jgi:two-component system, OmpR family, sensor histidine kinase MtrB
MVAIAALAVATSISLVTLTTYLHRTTATLGLDTDTIRMVEEMEINLFLHGRSKDAIERANIANELLHNLSEVQKLVNPSSAEATALEEARRQVNTYLDGGRDARTPEEVDAALSDAFAALDRVVDQNVDQTKATLQEAERWDRWGNWIGFGSTAILLVATAALLLWLRLYAFRSVLELQDAMSRFAGKMEQVRAPESGPEELRNIAKQFNEMADALARQRENLLSFLAAIAHDLRNPLGNLKMSAEILSPGNPIDPNRLASLSRVIARQVDLLDRMVGDLLDASRIEAGQLELRFEKRDARTIVNEVYELFQSSTAGHDLKLRLPEKPVEVRCDPMRIQQVLNNLVSNAIKYSPNGGPVQIALEQKEDKALIQVTDQGLGIPRDELPHIFDPFRRGRVSRELAPGVGLGLSVARRIVQAHGGDINAESEFGKGTTVKVYLGLAA